jgi:hypothetical protein
MPANETWAEKVERTRPERETQPVECSHCTYKTTALTNYSKDYGGNIGAHWLCQFCEYTRSASALGAGGRPDQTVQDVAAMLNVLAARWLDRPVASGGNIGAPWGSAGSARRS